MPRFTVLNSKSALGEGSAASRFVVYAAFARKELDDALDAFHGRMDLMLFATAGVLAAAFLQGAIGLMPLRRLRERAAAVRVGRVRDFGTDGPRDVQPLVNEINLLLVERATAVERAHARASDLAHGVKTLLTVLAHLAENLPAEDRAVALQQVDLVRQRADRQLQAARMGVERVATTSILSLGGKLVSVLRPTTEERGIVWETDIDPLLSLDIDPADFAECLGNLLDNGAKWARSRIRLSARRTGDDVTISVEDDGPGVADGDREAILVRGMRLDPEDGAGSNGSGLGLAISADIADAYGAALTLGRPNLGGLAAILTSSGRTERKRPFDPA